MSETVDADISDVANALAATGATGPDEPASGGGGSGGGSSGRSSYSDALLSRLTATGPHEPIEQTEAFRLDPTMATRYLSRGTQKAASSGGWPAWLDFLLTTAAFTRGVVIGAYADESAQTGGEQGPEIIESDR